ncbi:MAG: GNAT family N-acetyltransferase [Bdellovibrionaceae bacterium]|nr:GNAT family N-acetyltransferase [Bdellovibrionales bacterium]MCB9085201.1 GNAT family N-acetyltransferase [Pseudobdellovibrionaceae bacterium]
MKVRKLPEEIVAERVALRRHSLETAQTMFEYVDSDRARLGEFLPWVEYTQTLEDEIGYIKMTHEKWAEGTLFDYSIFKLGSGEYIGNVGLHSISWENAKCEIGYWILGKFEGQGLMSAAVQALETICFQIGFNRVEIRCSSLNLKSAGVPRRLDYHLDGTLREDSAENGRFRDTLVFSKLKREVKK